VDDDSKQFYALYLTRFAGGFGFMTLSILLPKYVTVLQASDFMAGLFYAVFTLAQTLAVVPLAWLGDRHDKRRVLLGCLSLGVVVYAGFALVGSSSQLLAARAVQALVVTGMGLMSLSLVGELAGAGDRARRIGESNSSRFLASIVGGMAAGLIYDNYGFEPVFGLVASVYVITLLAVLLYLPADETRVPGFPFRDLALNRRILTLAAFRAPYAVAVTLTRAWVAYFAGLEVARGGLFFSAFAVSIVLSSEKFTNMLAQPFTGRLSDTHGRARFVLGGGAAYGLVALAIPAAPTIGQLLSLPGSLPFVGRITSAFLALVLLNGLLGFADAFREPASMALFADEGSDGNGVASSFGVRELVWRPGSVVAPLLGGWLMGAVGMASVFYVGGGAALFAAALFLVALVSGHGRDALTNW